MTPEARAPHLIVQRISSLSRHLVFLVPLSMLAGFIVGLLVDLTPLKVLVVPLTMAMVYPMLVNFKPAEALHLRDARAVGTAMGLNFVVMPLLALALATLAFAEEPGLFVGMLLVGLFPTSGMTISWTGFANGNVTAAVKMTVIGLLVAAVLAPLYLYLLAGAVVDVDVLSVARTIVLVIGVPMVAGVITRKVLVGRYGQQQYRQRIAPVFPGLSTLGVLAIVFLAIGLKAPAIAADPLLLARIAVPLVAFYAGGFTVASLIGRRMERGDAVAVVYGTVMRNLSIALGIAVAQFGPEAALVLAGAYIVQVPSAAWYIRIADRVLCRGGECEQEAGPSAV